MLSWALEEEVLAVVLVLIIGHGYFYVSFVRFTRDLCLLFLSFYCDISVLIIGFYGLRLNLPNNLLVFVIFIPFLRHLFSVPFCFCGFFFGTK